MKYEIEILLVLFAIKLQFYDYKRRYYHINRIEEFGLQLQINLATSLNKKPLPIDHCVIRYSSKI